MNEDDEWSKVRFVVDDWMLVVEEEEWTGGWGSLYVR